MEMISFFQILGATLLRSGAVHVVQIAGIVWALQKLNSHPRRAKFALIGLIIGLINGLISTGLSAAMPMMLMRGNTAQIGLLMGGVGFLSGLISAVGLGFLVWAVFVEE